MTTQTQAVEAPARFQCRHIHTDGRRCGSPTLRHEHFCYYHHTTRKPIPRADLAARYADQNRNAPFDLPLPEDRASIQLAIGEILRRIAANQLDNRRAGLLLYGLQIAATNLPPQRREAEEPQKSRQQVEEITEHETLGTLAPQSEFTAPKGEKTLEQILTEQWAKDKEEAAEKARLHPPAPERPDYIWSDEEEGLVLKAVAEPGLHEATSPKPAPTKSALIAFIPSYPRNLSSGTSTPYKKLRTLLRTTSATRPKTTCVAISLDLSRVVCSAGSAESPIAGSTPSCVRAISVIPKFAPCRAVAAG
ncbi:hypothetical protein AciX9_0867 [Granulicella tundricola MP5ACTX9]|uniref:Uncharacterized protein n=1 Tax=Granulicella tundricola (strain ATCC BAA-1859 / DSM 23138 / MP5ACTX9) TaxID=1198114 RepID=E8X169_GRATM|nr:hypothetical protein AciX9_0867 [Granulicella tundricola MP5ACTX9]